MTAPAYSLIIPAYNEAAHLPATLAAAQQAMQAVNTPGELIVVDNNSTDDTAAIARSRGAAVVFEPHNQISRARNAGANAARGRVLIFIDADTHITADLLHAALETIDTDQAVAGGVVVRFDEPVIRPAAVVLWLWNLYSRIAKEAAGCFLFCTREAYDGAGGFSERVYASEEIWFCKAVKRWARKQGRPRGKRLIILTDTPITTSARKAAKPWRTFGTLALLILFPPAVLFRGLCGFWYRKDTEINHEDTKNTKTVNPETNPS